MTIEINCDRWIRDEGTVVVLGGHDEDHTYYEFAVDHRPGADLAEAVGEHAVWVEVEDWQILGRWERDAKPEKGGEPR